MANFVQNLSDIITGVIYGYYVKYDRLIALINEEFKGSTATEVNIFIDLYDIYHKIDNHIKNSNTSIENPLVLVSTVINMVAHYRTFFATRYNCTTRFWLINSKDNIFAKQYYPEFKKNELSWITKDILKYNNEFLPLLCKYIEDIAYIDCNVDFLTQVKYILEVEKPNNPSLCITKDPFSYQGVLLNNVKILCPKKNKGEDLSYMVNETNACMMYISAINKKFTECSLTKDYLLILMALSRVPSRNLKNIYTIPFIIRRLNTPIAEDVLSFLESFCTIYGKPDLAYTVQCRYKACDVTSLQYMAYELTPDSRSYTGIVNLYDPKSLMAINEKYFKQCPIDIYSL